MRLGGRLGSYEESRGLTAEHRTDASLSEALDRAPVIAAETLSDLGGELLHLQPDLVVGVLRGGVGGMNPIVTSCRIYPEDGAVTMHWRTAAVESRLYNRSYAEKAMLQRVLPAFEKLAESRRSV
jgi:hypothetical protein